MTVKELIIKLQDLDPDAEVLTYIEEAEEYGGVDQVKVFSPSVSDDMPYSKGDILDLTHDTILIIGEARP